MPFVPMKCVATAGINDLPNKNIECKTINIGKNDFVAFFSEINEITAGH